MKRTTVKDLVLQQIKFGVKKPASIFKAMNGQANRQHVYAVLAKLKKDGLITKGIDGYVLTPVNKSEVAYKASKGAKTKRTYTKRTRYENINGAQVLISKDVEKLQAEVFKLNDWCIQWSNKVREADQIAEAKYREELSRLKYMICDKDAVIAYLEDKLVQVFGK